MVTIKLLGIHSPIDAPNRYDVGTGFIVNVRTETVDGVITLKLYQIAVVDGRFDGHRNDLGELWVTEKEIIGHGPEEMK